MKRNVLIGAAVVVVLLVTYFIVQGNRRDDSVDIMVTAQTGEFQVDIETTGELEAKNSVKIYGPRELRQYRIHQVKIDRIIEEKPA